MATRNPNLMTGGERKQKRSQQYDDRLDPDSKIAAQRLKVMREPLWELQPGETQKAYNHFRTYRDMGSSRLHEKVAELNGIAVTTIASLSSRNRWVERVRAFDAYYDTIVLGAQERALRDASRSWVARAERIREMEYELSMGIAAKLREMLRWPIDRVVTRVRHTSGGVLKAYTEIVIEPARWDWKAIGDLLRNAGFQARLSAEMVTDGARAPQADGTDRGVSDIDAWLSDIGVQADRVEAKQDDA